MYRLKAALIIINKTTNIYLIIKIVSSSGEADHNLTFDCSAFGPYIHLLYDYGYKYIFHSNDSYEMLVWSDEGSSLYLGETIVGKVYSISLGLLPTYCYKYLTSSSPPDCYRASRSLLNIRGRHCHATRKASKAGYGNISQRDMALTQFGFMGFALLRPKELGISGSEADFEGFVHFWRVIGHFLGIKDK